MVVDSWRRLHSSPLRTFRNNLRKKATSRGIVATRLKRLFSIIAKLERLPRIKLSRMQDIGGCRVVVPNADDASKVAGDFAGSRIRHELIRSKDYISEPRETGYRGIHLIYAFQSERRQHLNGLNVEIQFRSRLQHQWATAVETVGTFISQDLKSGVGDPEWLRFFALVSSVIAQRETRPVVPGTPKNERHLIEALRECAIDNNVSQRLSAFQQVTRLAPRSTRSEGYWHVLELDMDKRQIRGHSFGVDLHETAFSLYSNKEIENRGNPHVDVVLVSADSLKDLRRAYPNYFTDLADFRRLLQETLS